MNYINGVRNPLEFDSKNYNKDFIFKRQKKSFVNPESYAYLQNRPNIPVEDLLIYKGKLTNSKLYKIEH